jgi:hypothetical protein
LKVLPLGGYDVIIGMYWLQSHNPMRIDWVGKRMAFWSEGKLVLLNGVHAQIGSSGSGSQCSAFTVATGVRYRCCLSYT